LKIGGENLSCPIDHEHGIWSRFEHRLAVGVSPPRHLTLMSGNGSHAATCASILTHYNHKTKGSRLLCSVFFSARYLLVLSENMAIARSNHL
jgi:hypothetical protein